MTPWLTGQAPVAQNLWLGAAGAHLALPGGARPRPAPPAAASARAQTTLQFLSPAPVALHNKKKCLVPKVGFAGKGARSARVQQQGGYNNNNMGSGGKEPPGPAFHPHTDARRRKEDPTTKVL